MVRTPRSTTDGYLRRHKPDYSIVLVTVLLLLFGAVLVYTISPALDQSAVLYRQLSHIVLAGITFLAASLVPIDLWRKFHPAILVGGFATSLMLLVPGLGEEVNGATRWLNLGPISFQPAELLKFALVLYLSAWLSERIRTNKLNRKNESLIPILIITGLTGLLVAILQKDLGTMVALASIIATMFFISGVNMKIFSRYIGLIGSAGLALVLLFPHRLQRLFTFINPNGDVDGTGYHIDQALIAIGSGGWFGRGLGKSVQVFGYLPEAISDSVFAIVGEQFGFIGSLLILFLYGALAFRVLRIIDRAPTAYMRLIGAGMFGWLTAHVFINIGAMLGLIPLTGITLPFLSLGGTSLIFISAGFGIIFNISRYTSLAYIKEDHETRQASSSSSLVGRRGYSGARFASLDYRNRAS